MPKYGTGLLQKAREGLSRRKEKLDSAIDSASGGTGRHQTPTKSSVKSKKKKSTSVYKDGSSYSQYGTSNKRIRKP